ncbi:MAG TPA: DUF5916 domain-containing protein [Longimicrobiales bacterium]|nr:DUF5916 domain-containing protein [Longimicrobiales bacterium]
MRASVIATLLLLPLFPLAGSGQAVQETGAGRRPSRSARAAVVEQPPIIDGRLDDRAWSAAEALSGFVQREPMEGEPVSERTEVRIVYDEAAVYVGAWLYDRDPSAIVLGQTLRDASLTDTDAFQIVFDTYRDGQNGFVFATTPSGIEYDGQVTDEGGGGGGRGGRQQSGSGGGFNLNWDGSWEVATSTDDEGWYAEFRIPFSTLRYARGGPQTWGVNFARNVRRRNEESLWAPVPRQYNLHRVSLAGTLDQLEAPARRIFTVTPFALGDAFRDYTLPVGSAECFGSSGRTDCGAEIGGDAKIGVTQSLTLDLTANTDFAQVEVDDQQVNLTRFPLFFPEKRGFFLENAGTFAVGTGRQAELFFSRRIGLSRGNAVPILGGARLTGRVGGLQVGFLDIQTDKLERYDAVAGITQRIAPSNNFGVARVVREFENRTQIGGIFVSRVNTDDSGDYNLTYGLEGSLGIGDAVTLDAWGATTSTPGMVGEEYAFSGGGQYETRDWEISAGYHEVGEGFNPEVGFLSRGNYRSVNARALRHVRFDQVPWFREIRPHASWTEFWDMNGFSETRLVHIDNHFEFANGAFFQFPGLNFTGEGLKEPFEIRPGIFIPPGSYNNVDFEFRANTNTSAPLSIRLGGNAGGFYTGTRVSPNATVAYRYQDRLTTSLRAEYYDVRLNDADKFTTAVLAFTGSYSFTPRLYLQAQLQYNDDTEDLGTNLRLGWLDTAGTGLYVVYNDTEHFGSLRSTGIRYGPKQRQLIIKYTKQFDLTR